MLSVSTIFFYQSVSQSQSVANKQTNGGQKNQSRVCSDLRAVLCPPGAGSTHHPRNPQDPLGLLYRFFQDRSWAQHVPLSYLHSLWGLSVFGPPGVTARPISAAPSCATTAVHSSINSRLGTAVDHTSYLIPELSYDRTYVLYSDTRTAR